MAKNDTGLYLPLKIDLDEWEKSLLEADADLQKQMRKMKSAASDMKLKYDVQIAGARAAGNELKALELENKKLTQTFELQKRAVEALNKAYEKSIKEKGANARETQALAKQLVRESNALVKLQRDIDNVGVKMGAKLSNSLASVSPEFARIRSVISGITNEIGQLGSKLALVGKAVGGIGLGVGIGVATYKGVEQLVKGYKELALTAANANEEVYQLREELNDTYENAELLAGAARIDGTNLQELGSALNKLNKKFDESGEKISVAQQWLERYGASLRNGDGTRKSVIEQMNQIQQAFLRAEAEGNGRDFLANTFGNASDKLMHFIRGFDDYIARAKSYRVEMEKDYQAAHDLLDLQKERAEVERQLASAKGNAALGNANEIMKIEIAALQEQYQWYKDNAETVDEYGKNLVILTQNLSAMGNAWESIKVSAKNAAMEGFTEVWNILNKINDLSKNENLKNFGLGPARHVTNFLAEKGLNINPVSGLMKSFGNFIDDTNERKSNMEITKVDQELMREINAMDSVFKEESDKKKRAEAEKTEETKKSEQKRLEIAEKFSKLRNELLANDYERDMLRLEDKKQAYIKEGMSEVQAAELVAIEKDKINQKYAEKERAELERQTKEKEKEYQNQVKQAELYQKQIENARKSQIQDAESTLTGNKKLLRYINQQKQKGTYNEEDIKAYAERLYMRQNDIRYSDIDTLRSVGIDKIKQFADVRSRLFGQFADVQAPTATNNIVNNVNNTVNFDNTVVDDVATMDKLANKVADIIIPSIERAIKGGEEYGY